MARKSYLFTSESVSEGHPDKVCDRISDEIVDLFYREGPKAGIDPWAIRAACETLATTNRVVIAGETRGPETVTKDWIAHVARMAIRDIGYEQEGFHWEKANIEVLLASAVGRHRRRRRRDAARRQQGRGRGRPGHHVRLCLQRDAGADAGADLLRAQDPARPRHGAAQEGRRRGAKLGPDAKSQVTVRYEDGKPVGVTQIVVSHQHIDEDLSSRKIRDIVEPYVRKTLPDGWIGKDTVWHVNPTGKFFIGGPDGDTGLTGRKIIVDTYGGAAPHGGGAFSGKDPTKVDRSAAYAARYLAKNVVAAGLADRCTIQLSYAIGVAKPLSIYVDTHGTGKVDEAKLEKALSEVMDLSPRGIRKHLDLNKPIYARTVGLRPLRARAGRGRRFLLGEDRPCRCHQEGRCA